VKCDSDVKNVDDLPNHGKKNDEKGGILRVFEKNPRLSLRGERMILHKRNLNILPLLSWTPQHKKSSSRSKI